MEAEHKTTDLTGDPLHHARPTHPERQFFTDVPPELWRRLLQNEHVEKLLATLHHGARGTLPPQTLVKYRARLRNSITDAVVDYPENVSAQVEAVAERSERVRPCECMTCSFQA